VPKHRHAKYRVVTLIWLVSDGSNPEELHAFITILSAASVTLRDVSATDVEPDESGLREVLPEGEHLVSDGAPERQDPSARSIFDFLTKPPEDLRIPVLPRVVIGLE
jgi:hypothetical protein